MGKRDKRRKRAKEKKGVWPVAYEVGDLVWYYSPYGSRRYKCVVVGALIHAKRIKVYDFERGLSFYASKSCLKKLDKIT